MDFSQEIDTKLQPQLFDFSKKHSWTEEYSFNFTKKLITMTISTIMHLRNYFPSREFTLHYINDFPVLIINETSENQEVKFFVREMEKAFDAMEKKYLRRLILFFYVKPKESEEIKTLETYALSLRYDNGFTGNTLHQNSKCDITMLNLTDTEEIISSTIKMLNSCMILTKNLINVTPEIQASLKLLCYGYTPMSYMNAIGESAISNFRDITDECRCPKNPILKAPFHKIKLSMSYAEEQYRRYIDRVCCACKSLGGYGSTLRCRICKTLQHAICYNIYSSDCNNTNHICITCSDSNLNCTDTTLTIMLPKMREEVCVMRRVLAFMNTKDEISEKLVRTELDLSNRQFLEVYNTLSFNEVIHTSGNKDEEETNWIVNKVRCRETLQRSEHLGEKRVTIRWPLPKEALVLK
ncbi:HORMA domain-containing protein 2 isoform X2 [Cephus cinctus]|uniref:HORMA domain-containing protein 2 isoform X2 n=1 Tax=Cephus cinctus TaxID=211228 RepID=A0AAJ7RBU9_CEPCN|nr:HORMA domain-containing protein 2 isoform X2 [Cephus cinctus]